MSAIHHKVILTVEAVQEKIRIDAYVAGQIGQLSRSLASSERVTIMVAGVVVKKSRPVRSGDVITVEWTEHALDDVEAQDIPLNVLYEDESVLVIDKQQSLVVHPGAGNPDGTLVNALVFRYGSAFMEEGASETADEEEEWPLDALRPGIVHRLDKETSGIMVVAKTRQALVSLAKQFKERKVAKRYIALVKGTMERPYGMINNSIARSQTDRTKFTVDPRGKQASTEYRVLRQFSSFALVGVVLHTGRTHQIRVHMASIGHPVLGDDVYGKRWDKIPDATLMLHAQALEFDHPATDGRVRLRSPMPERFKMVIRNFGKGLRDLPLR